MQVESLHSLGPQWLKSIVMFAIVVECRVATTTRSVKRHGSIGRAPDLVPHQQIGPTHVRWRGRTLCYFGGCDYFRLSRHPAVLRATQRGLSEFGLNVAASRLTTGHHAAYTQLEREMVRFFDAESALLLPSGYLSDLAVAQALAGEFSIALIDERAHACLRDAAQMLGCRVRQFRHRDVADLARVLARCSSKTRPLVLTDGMFSADGTVAPLRDYLAVLPRRGMILVDDAHGAGVLGRRGRGTLEFAGVGRSRVVQTITLSKAFGVYGGAVLCSRELRRRILASSRVMIGATPLPPPLANAALASVKTLATNPHLREQLRKNAGRVRSALAAAGFVLPDSPGPIISICPRHSRDVARLRRALLAANILPPFMHYPGGPRAGHFRFAISSAHTAAQLNALTRVLIETCGP